MSKLEITNHIKFYEYWRMNYGFKYVAKNFIRITKMYGTLKDLCIAFGMEKEFHLFFKKPCTMNVFFSESFLGKLTISWKDKRALNYMFYIDKLFMIRR